SNAALAKVDIAPKLSAVQKAIEQAKTDNNGRPLTREEQAALTLKVLTGEAAKAAATLEPTSAETVNQQLAQLKKPQQQLVNSLQARVKDQLAQTKDPETIKQLTDLSEKLNALSQKLAAQKEPLSPADAEEMLKELATIAKTVNAKQVAQNISAAGQNLHDVIVGQKMAEIVKSELLDKKESLGKKIDGKAVAKALLKAVNKAAEGNSEINISRSDLLAFIDANLPFVIEGLGKQPERTAALQAAVREIADGTADPAAKNLAEKIIKKIGTAEQPADAGLDFDEQIGKMLGQVPVSTLPAASMFKATEWASPNTKPLKYSLQRLMDKVIEDQLLDRAAHRTVETILSDLEASTRFAAGKAEQGAPFLAAVKANMSELVKKIAQELPGVEARKLQQQIVASKDEKGLLAVLKQVRALDPKLQANRDLDQSIENLTAITDLKQARADAKEFMAAVKSGNFDPQELYQTFCGKGAVVQGKVLTALQDFAAKSEPDQKLEALLNNLSRYVDLDKPVRESLARLAGRLKEGEAAVFSGTAATWNAVVTAARQGGAEKKEESSTTDREGRKNRISVTLDKAPADHQAVTAVAGVERYASRLPQQQEKTDYDGLKVHAEIMASKKITAPVA
ncbi:MAG TPA: hypothetical protein VMT55_05540, partial [Candidatus Sulfotelmatobacter sp.]|nr:hypothetical protein [Candidatus Sulfotelmatobacter sp.]